VTNTNTGMTKLAYVQTTNAVEIIT